jgi:Raf kinase inhibitor-like YbhB/YbcL family protein
VFLLLAAACDGGGEGADPSISPIPTDLGAFGLSSPAFPDAGPIPDEFTCRGANISPALVWAGVPDGAVELLLTLHDPDAPSGVFTHWTVFAIDPAVDGMPAGAIPPGALEGTNDFRDVGYGGPCPPEGESHRYFFTLAALSAASGLQPGASPSEVDAAVGGATATTTMTGSYPG